MILGPRFWVLLYALQYFPPNNPIFILNAGYFDVPITFASLCQSCAHVDVQTSRGPGLRNTYIEKTGNLLVISTVT